MEDITKTKPKLERPWPEYGIDLLIAGLPASVIITIINQLGITGALVPIITILLFTHWVGKIRIKREAKRQSLSRKRIIAYTLIGYVIVLIILPMVGMFILG